MASILIVDDDEDFAMATATVLRNSGHEVHIELNIKSAEKSIRDRRPDLIILDVMFPESSSAGFELARRIRKYDNELKNVPILLLTSVNAQFPLGFGTQDIDDQWLPVEDFLEKPVDYDVLSKKVSDMLS